MGVRVTGDWVVWGDWVQEWWVTGCWVTGCRGGGCWGDWLHGWWVQGWWVTGCWGCRRLGVGPLHRKGTQPTLSKVHVKSNSGPPVCRQKLLKDSFGKFS